MTKVDFEKLLKRLGPLAVQEALARKERQTKGLPSTRERLTNAGTQAYRLLFESPEAEDLWEWYQNLNGVSEPATVPHQSPRAGDTPGSENGKR